MYDNEYILEHYDVYEYLLHLMAKKAEEERKKSTKI